MINSNKLYIYRFICCNIPEDITNDKGKVTKFKEVHCIARDEQSARTKAKLDNSYLLADVNSLGSAWYA